MPTGVFKRSEEHKRKISLALLGHKQSEETKEKLRLSFSGRYAGEKHPMYGKHHSDEIRKKISLNTKGKQANEKHWAWKGDNVGYGALHDWIRKNLPKPELCEICNIKPAENLANMTGVYDRNLNHWEYLCVSCHILYDRTVCNLKPYAKLINSLT